MSYPQGVNDPDAELVEKLRAEKPGAFEEMFHRYWRRVMALALSHLPDSCEAEDAAIETFADLARGIKNFRGDAKLSTYIYRVALNRIRKHRRRNSRQIQTVPLESCPELVAATPKLEEELNLKREVEELIADINRLPRRQREAVILRHLAGLSLAEVAAVLNVSTPVAGMRINRGINQLKKLRRRRRKMEGV